MPMPDAEPVAEPGAGPDAGMPTPDAESDTQGMSDSFIPGAKPDNLDMRGDEPDTPDMTSVEPDIQGIRGDMNGSDTMDTSSDELKGISGVMNKYISGDSDIAPFERLDRESSVRPEGCPPCPECICPESPPCRSSAVYRKASSILKLDTSNRKESNIFELDTSNRYSHGKIKKKRKRKKPIAERAKSLTFRKNKGRKSIDDMTQEELKELILEQEDKLNKRTQRKGRKKKKKKKGDSKNKGSKKQNTKKKKAKKKKAKKSYFTRSKEYLASII